MLQDMAKLFLHLAVAAMKCSPHYGGPKNKLKTRRAFPYRDALLVYIATGIFCILLFLAISSHAKPAPVSAINVPTKTGEV